VDFVCTFRKIQWLAEFKRHSCSRCGEDLPRTKDRILNHFEVRGNGIVRQVEVLFEPSFPSGVLFCLLLLLNSLASRNGMTLFAVSARLSVELTVVKLNNSHSTT
jgi:hypothetical protein